MNKQGPNGIKYIDLTWNPKTGCLHGCPWDCWAEGIANRFVDVPGGPYNPHGFEPHFYPERLTEPLHRRKPSIIGVCFMGDLFGKWVPAEWIEKVLDICKQADWHKFLLLTKNPRRYGEFEIPANCWCGTSTTGNDEERILDFHKYAPDNNRFISLEPFTGLINKTSIYLQGNYQWLIIGGLTGKSKKTPPTEDVDLVVRLAQIAGIRVFIKSNAGYSKVIQEYPEGLR